MRFTTAIVFLTALIVGCGTQDKPADETNCGDPATPCAEDLGTPPGDDAAHDDPDMGGSATDDTGSAVDSGDAADSDASADAGDEGDVSTRCGRKPGATDRPRKVVVARPFTDTLYEVLDLSADGVLSRPNVTFAMGKGREGTIQFTPDGEVGFAVQDGGKLGIFRFNNSGQPEVLSAIFDPGFYVSGILIDPSGDVLWGWETGFRDVGGALFRMELDCASGMPSQAMEFAPAKLVRGAAFLDADTMVLAAVDVLDDEAPNDVHLLGLAGPTRLASTPAFPDTDAIGAGFAVTADGRYAVLGDNSAFSGIENRVGVVRIDGGSLSHVQNIDVPDPVTIVTSPFDDAAIVLSTTADQIQLLTYNPSANPPFVLQGPITTTQSTLLPLSAAMIERGTLRGRVLVGENVAVRQLQFEGDGTVTDLGLLEFGSSVEQITGAVGVQP